jgi:hypothetical protein
MARLDFFELDTKPVTLPAFNLADIDIEAEAREAAERVAEQRTIRAGRDAWHLIGKAQSFENWKLIGAALAIGKQRALRATGANDTSSRHYIKWFSRWLLENGFGVMKPHTRSWAIALHENAEAITAWRDSLPSGRGRRPPINPQSCVKGWQRSQHSNGHAPDWQREAISAWKRFLVCVQALPPADQAALWHMVHRTKVVADAA